MEPTRGTAIERQTQGRTRRVLSWAVAAVWLHQGLWAKVLGRDRRHTEIVADVPLIGPERARAATIAIGSAEVALALWVVSNRRRLAAAAAQTLMLAGMNAGGLALSHERIPAPTRLLARNLGFLALVWTAAGVRRPR